MAGEPEPGVAPEPSEIDIDAVDDLSTEDVGKLQRGEIEPPKKGKAATDAPAIAKDEFDIDPSVTVVPHSKFHNVNERRKAAEAETARERGAREAAEARANTAVQRMSELLEASRPAPVQQRQDEAPADPGAEPDGTEQPIEWIAWRQQKDRFDAHQQTVQHSQQTEAQQRENQYRQWTAQGIQEFKAQTPDYDDARGFFWNQRGPELMALGYTQDQAIRLIEQDEIGIRDAAIARRQNPAEAMYAIAKIRGYQPGNGQADAVDPAAVNGNADRTRDATGKFTAAVAAMDKREATKAAAKSLGGSGGPADGGELTAQQIADMSDSEYKAFKAKWDKQLGEGGAMRKAMGVAR